MKQSDIPVLFSQEQIYQRVHTLVEQINEDYKNAPNLLVICILQGSFTFSADLVRKIDLNFQLDFMELSSYEGKKSTGEITLSRDLQHPVKDQNILIVEDIVDTGATLNYIYDYLEKRGAAQIETAALLVKKHSEGKTHPVKYRGFEIDEEFAVGYGMDYQGKYRELPYIGYLP